MNPTYLIIDCYKFISELERKKLDLLSLHKISDLKYEAFGDILTSYENEIIAWLKSGFNIENNYFVQDYRKVYNSRRNGFKIPGLKVNPDINELKNDIANIVSYLDKIVLVINSLDFIKGCSSGLNLERANLNLTEKRHLILSKIILMGNGMPIPMKWIYAGLGLKEGIANEALELGYELERAGLVDKTEYANGDLRIRINVTGQMFIENEIQNLLFKEDLSQKEKEVLKEQIQEIKEEIKTFVNVKFEENKEFITTCFTVLDKILDESLQLASSKIGKANIRQLIKGKIVELGEEKSFEAIALELL